MLVSSRRTLGIEFLNHVTLIAVARHSVERYSYTKVLIAFAWLAEMIGLPYGVGNIMTTLLMELPHSRKQEYEGLPFHLPAKSQ